jgi:hypothetical protein
VADAKGVDLFAADPELPGAGNQLGPDLALVLEIVSPLAAQAGQRDLSVLLETHALLSL